MLTVYPSRAVVAWSAALAWVWLLLFSPWTAGWNAVGALAVALAAMVAIGMATRRRRAQRAVSQDVLGALDATLCTLPADVQRNTPLVLVVSDFDGPPAEVSAAHPAHITGTAIWVHAGSPAQLMHLADALKRWRNGQGPDAIAYLLDTGTVPSHTLLSASLQRWRAAIGLANRALGYALPVYVALYVREPRAQEQECPWFGVGGSRRLRLDTLAQRIAACAWQYTGIAAPPLRQYRAYRAAQLDAATRWACAEVLPRMVAAQRSSQALHVTGFGVTVVEGSPQPDSLYARFIQGATGLRAVAARPHEPAPYPLPEPLLRGIVPRPAQRPRVRALAHACAALAVWLCAAAAASAWQNRALVQHMSRNMTRYRALLPAQDTARVDALQAVQRDRDALERYARQGVPPRLSLGFYQGAALLPEANALIASYRAPAPPPSTIELDSMSLFDTGSAVLHPGTNRLLVDALEMIKAHPDKRVLVAGHTDSVGSDASNLRLSEARAASVRDWLADASAIPASHFAIQGYGESRPKASNDNPAGRAANRRVEITLVPDCRDDRSNLGQTACSLE